MKKFISTLFAISWQNNKHIHNKIFICLSLENALHKNGTPDLRCNKIEFFQIGVVSDA